MLKTPSRRHSSVLPSLSLLLPLTLMADAPVTPEPKVIASVEKVAGQSQACIVTVEVRTPDTDEALAAPSFRVAAGHSASSTATSSTPVGARTVAVTVEAGPDCAGGTYNAKVMTNGSLALAKAGALLPKGK